MLVFMFSVLPTGLDLSKESLPGWSYMFELRDQNSNVSLVYSMIQCVSPGTSSLMMKSAPDSRKRIIRSSSCRLRQTVPKHLEQERDHNRDKDQGVSGCRSHRTSLWL